MDSGPDEDVDADAGGDNTAVHAVNMSTIQQQETASSAPPESSKLKVASLLLPLSQLSLGDIYSDADEPATPIFEDPQTPTPNLQRQRAFSPEDAERMESRDGTFIVQCVMSNDSSDTCQSNDGGGVGSGGGCASIATAPMPLHDSNRTSKRRMGHTGHHHHATTDSSEDLEGSSTAESNSETGFPRGWRKKKALRRHRVAQSKRDKASGRRRANCGQLHGAAADDPPVHGRHPASSVTEGLDLLDLPSHPEEILDLEEELRRKGYFAQLTVDDQVYSSTRDHFEELQTIGRGAFGTVKKVRHHQLNKLFAVKKLRDEDSSARRQLITDLKVIRQANYQYIVKYYGFCCTEGDIWIYMEYMMMSLESLYRQFKEALPKQWIPEDALGVVAVSVLRGLDYLFEVHKVMHRDVKPSNILIGFDGSVRVCDFGVSTVMMKSIAKTAAGSEKYLPPERLDPDTSKNAYRLTSDVWSYGLTMHEVALLSYPYNKSEFKRIMEIIHEEPPRLQPDEQYSAEFCDLLAVCLTKSEPERPYYRTPARKSSAPGLLDHPFIRLHADKLDKSMFDMIGWLETWRDNDEPVPSPRTSQVME